MYFLEESDVALYPTWESEAALCSKRESVVDLCFTGESAGSRKINQLENDPLNTFSFFFYLTKSVVLTF